MDGRGGAWREALEGGSCRLRWGNQKAYGLGRAFLGGAWLAGAGL